MRVACRALKYNLTSVQDAIWASFRADKLFCDPRRDSLLKMASAEQICNLLNEGVSADAQQVWKSLQRAWLPQSRSEVNLVLQCLQLDQMDAAMLGGIMQIIKTWDLSSSEHAKAQAAIAICCYTALGSSENRKIYTDEQWTGRADGKMLPGPLFGSSSHGHSSASLPRLYSPMFRAHRQQQLVAAPFQVSRRSKLELLLAACQGRYK